MLVEQSHLEQTGLHKDQQACKKWQRIKMINNYTLYVAPNGAIFKSLAHVKMYFQAMIGIDVGQFIKQLANEPVHIISEEHDLEKLMLSSVQNYHLDAGVLRGSNLLVWKCFQIIII